MAHFPNEETPEPDELDVEGDVAGTTSALQKLTQHLQKNREQRDEILRGIVAVKARIAEQKRQVAAVEQRLAQERAAAERLRLQQEQERKKKQMILLAGLAVVGLILLLILLK